MFRRVSECISSWAAFHVIGASVIPNTLLKCSERDDSVARRREDGLANVTVSLNAIANIQTYTLSYRITRNSSKSIASFIVRRRALSGLLVCNDIKNQSHFGQYFFIVHLLLRKCTPNFTLLALILIATAKRVNKPCTVLFIFSWGCAARLQLFNVAHIPTPGITIIVWAAVPIIVRVELCTCAVERGWRAFGIPTWICNFPQGHQSHTHV